MRAPPDLAALHALHGAFFDIFTVMRVQQCAPGARAGGRAMATVPSIFRGPEGRAENRRRRRDADRRTIFCSGSRLAGACRLPFTGLRCCVLMRRGGKRLQLPDTDSRRRARSCDTRSRRPHGCRALSCAHCCAACMWGCRVSGRPCMRGRQVGAGCALCVLARAAPRGSLSPAASRGACEVLVRGERSVPTGECPRGSRRPAPVSCR